jgi:mersacidin/lichenicidin family type 2 lantibiotic
MDTKLIVRAWKDPGFRAELSAEQREALPECPAGKSLTELDEEDLGIAIGGAPSPTAPVLCDPSYERYTMNYYCCPQ